MNKSIIGMTLAILALMLVGVWQRGPVIILEGFSAGGKMLFNVLPLVLVIFLLIGLFQALIPQNKIKKWMGADAGIKGVFLGGAAGALMPGGPYVFSPMAASFLLSGAEIGSVIAFVMAKNLWSLSMIAMEIALLGPEITFIRLVITFTFPIIIGMVANIFFKKWGEKIRQQLIDHLPAGEKS